MKEAIVLFSYVAVKTFCGMAKDLNRRLRSGLMRAVFVVNQATAVFFAWDDDGMHLVALDWVRSESIDGKRREIRWIAISPGMADRDLPRVSRDQ